MFGGSFFKEFEEDPFFSGHMDRFNHSFPSIQFEDRNDRRHKNDRSVSKRNEDPFSNMFSFTGMDKFMNQMHASMKDLDSKDGHSFHSSSVMTYRNDGKGDPKIFQASSSTHRAPGNIRESRKALRDSESGIEKMSIGHHIAERGKVIERHRNVKKSNAYQEEKNFYHMGEEDEADFDNEWRTKTSNLNYTLGGSTRARPIQDKRRPKFQDKNADRLEENKKYIKTPAAGALRPSGPSKSGRARSKY